MHPIISATTCSECKTSFAKRSEDGVTEAELEQAKNKIASHVILQSERTGNRLFAVGVNWLQRGTYRHTRDIVADYQAVTLDDVHAVLEKYPLSQNTTYAIGPLAEVHRAFVVGLAASRLKVCFGTTLTGTFSIAKSGPRFRAR